MDFRPLGRTGVSVSQLCLGAMMFGAFGNPDHDDAVKIIHKALDAGINFIDTADSYSAGESEEILGKALAGGRREGVVLAVKFGVPFRRFGPQPSRSVAAVDHRSGRGLAAPASDRLDRPLSSGCSRSEHRYRRDPRRPVRSRPGRQDPLLRCVEGSRL
jgi:aryl-alcohol dehydrogenase-like predicted oxidoreductase